MSGLRWSDVGCAVIPKLWSGAVSEKRADANGGCDSHCTLQVGVLTPPAYLIDDLML